MIVSSYPRKGENMALIHVDKNKGENFETLFRRFKNRERANGKQMTLRSIRYFAKKLTKNKLHESAMRRLTKQEKLQYLLQSGKLDPKDIRNYRG
jgi:ribosomal protein S21